MNLGPPTNDVCRRKPVPALARHGKENGFAVLVVFILMSIMVVFVTSNALVLHHLHQEIKLVEKRQLKKFEAAPANSLVQTNAPDAGSE